MQFTVTITDPTKLAGITAARAAHNVALPDVFEDVKDKDGKPTGECIAVSPKPGTLATDAEYVQMVMDKAAESYARATLDPVVQLEQTRVELQAEREKVAQLQAEKDALMVTR